MCRAPLRTKDQLNEFICLRQIQVQANRAFFFSSFRARSIRAVLTHVPSPAPASLSHISALQFVSVLPLQRGEMSPLRFV